jgi:deazaflavin-dependent oxidoreductase (nitroreductase family)
MAGDRTRKYHIVTRLERLNNHFTRWLLRRDRAPKAYALLETVGRRSGRLRHTPVGDGLDGDTFWLIAVHGDQADYVRNIEGDPHVRVKVGRQWRSGTAVLLPDDDAVARSRTLPHQWDKRFGRIIASRPLTIRIDLEPRSDA